MARERARTTTPEEPEWQYDGHDWVQDDTGTWEIPTHEQKDNDPEFSASCLSYTELFLQDFPNMTICAVDAPKHIPPTTETEFMIQCDTGANICCTNRLDLLKDVMHIKESTVNTASNTSMTVAAMGKFPTMIGDNMEDVIMYYSPDSSGTILAPMAIVRQFPQRYCGARKDMFVDTGMGELIFFGRDGHANTRLPLYTENDLWWHVINGKPNQPYDADNGITFSISALSDAAKWELWHQRTAHRGRSVLESLHEHATGVPKLRGNAFYKCPSCMSGKATKQPTHTKQNLGSTRSTPNPSTKPDDDPSIQVEIEDVDDYLDELYLPDAQPGQHFHIDIGFVRGSDYRLKTEEGPTVTSIDGKRCYTLIVDRATRYMWAYVSATKDPPIEAVKAILSKFKSTAPNRTVRTDQDKSLGKSAEFKAMVEEQQFSLELTGSDASVQNSPAERPHRDLGEMMRCMSESSGLQSEYWSFMLPHAVFIKNRILHQRLKKSPFEALTGKKPDLSNLRIFGSRVYAKDPGKRKAKLDHHTSKGVFLGYSGTTGNIYYRDDATHNIKIGTHVLFDEAHMTVPASKAPLAAQALQRLGYHSRESWIDARVRQIEKSDKEDIMIIQKLSPTAIIPDTSTTESIGYDLYSNRSDHTLAPGETAIFPTGIAATSPHGSYIRIAPRSGLTVKRHLDTMAGVIDPDYTGELKVVVHNFGNRPQTLKQGDRIAQMIVEHASKPKIQVVDKLEPTERNDNGFGSTEKTKASSTLPFPIPSPTFPESSPEPPIAAAAATTELMDDPKFIRGIQLEMNIPYKFHLSTSPYDNHTHRLVACKGSDPTLGFIFEMCTKQSRPKLVDVQKSTPAARLPQWRSELRHAYVTSVNDIHIDTIQDITTIIADARKRGDLDVSFGFSTIGKQSTHPQTGLPQIYHDQMNVIAEHLWSLKNDPEWTERVLGYIPIAEKIMANNALDNDIAGDDDTIEGITATVKALHSNPAILADIKSLKSKKSIKQKNKLTRRILQKSDDWEKWKQSEWKQLDQYRDQSTFGDPEPRKADTNLLTLLWTYMIKDDGRLKARCVCNGSKRMTGSVTLAETYASSLDQHGARIFWAATAINNFVTIGADAANAFAEAPAPVAPLYVYCDEQYREWYRDRYPDRPPIPPGHVMRVQGALQGHPESARLWAILIDRVIRKLNLKPCTHEPNLYFSSNYNNTGKRVLFLRQVDDFAISCEDTQTAEDVISAINDSMTIEVKKLGLVTRYNGIDVMQTRQYIKIYNATYIDKLIVNHPWLNRNEYASAEFPLPMNSDSAYQRSLEQATPLSPEEKDTLEDELGFSYRQAIGELLYAVTTCRPDISYAAIKLSQYSTTPARVHYEAVMQVIRYLRDTKDDGIYYWREKPHMDLPIGPIPECKRDAYDESVATREDQQPNYLIGAKDSDFASDSKHRRSVTGVVLKLAGGTVLYKTKFQTVTAQSSTEAEFMAAAEAGKHILYLRTLLDEIGIEQIHATVLYEDNQGALLMANAQKPTKRTKHMDIKAFAIQEWIERDLLNVRRICTSDNYSDGLTKALGRTLFYRHNNYVMGRVIPTYAKQFATKTIRSLYNDIRIEDISDQTSEFITTFYESNFRSREGIVRRSSNPISQSDMANK